MLSTISRKMMMSIDDYIFHAALDFPKTSCDPRIITIQFYTTNMLREWTWGAMFNVK